MEALLILGAFLVLGVLAYFLGYDSRDGFQQRGVERRMTGEEQTMWEHLRLIELAGPYRHEDDLRRAEIARLLREATLADRPRPHLLRRIAHRIGVWLVSWGRRLQLPAGELPAGGALPAGAPAAGGRGLDAVCP